MPIPNYSIAPITKDDIPAIGTFLFNSKLQLAINRFLITDWPNLPLQKPHYTGAIERALSDPDTTSLKVVNDITGEPVAHLFYTKKATLHRRVEGGGKSASEGDGGDKEMKMKKDVPAGFNPDVYQTVMDFVEELEPEFETDEYMGERTVFFFFFHRSLSLLPTHQTGTIPNPTLQSSVQKKLIPRKILTELTHIYVEPSSRNQGIGTWLLQMAREAARDAGLPFTACAEPNFHRFFVNRGLKDAKYVDVDLRRWAVEKSGFGVFRVSRMVVSEE